MSFQHYVARSKQVEKSSVAPNTKKTYQSQLNSYVHFMQTIPDAPEPLPLTDENVRGFLEWYRSQHPTTTYGYLKLYVASFRAHLRASSDAACALNTPDGDLSSTLPPDSVPFRVHRAHRRQY